MLFIFSTPVLIRHLWQLKTVVILHWCLICAVLLMSCAHLPCLLPALSASCLVCSLPCLLPALSAPCLVCSLPCWPCLTCWPCLPCWPACLVCSLPYLLPALSSPRLVCSLPCWLPAYLTGPLALFVPTISTLVLLNWIFVI
jgi:hypothetical protein